MKLIVSDRESVERGLLVRTCYVMISIRDSDARPARIPQTSGLRDVLHLAFDDAEPTEGFVLPGKIRLMTPEQADEILQFVMKYHGVVGALVIHCHQGMSRSPAIAAALTPWFDVDAPQHCFHDYSPNRYVFEQVVYAGKRLGL